jgi:hypothetical protein
MMPRTGSNTIRQGMIASAWLAASAGIIGYFNVGGLGQYLTLYNRASGTFKDPNVFGPSWCFRSCSWCRPSCSSASGWWPESC